MHLGHADGHGHAVGERLASDRRALVAALLLTGTLMIAQIVAGVVAGSLALIADAAHMLTDAAALGLALAAAVLAARPARGRWTFGFRRAEILAAQINGVTLLVLAVWIVYASIERLISPREVRGGIVLTVALAGIAVNLLASALLARSRRRSLNVQAAFVHVVADVAAFAGTAVAGALVLATGWDRFDPLASLLVAGLILWGSARLLRDSTRILLESAPAEIDPHEVGRAIVAREEVVEAHDLHVWTVTSGFPALSAHVLVRAGADCHAVRRGLERMLADRFGIDHTTLQVEHASDAAVPIELGKAVRRETPLGHR